MRKLGHGINASTSAKWFLLHSFTSPILTRKHTKLLIIYDDYTTSHNMHVESYMLVNDDDGVPTQSSQYVLDNRDLIHCETHKHLNLSQKYLVQTGYHFLVE